MNIFTITINFFALILLCHSQDVLVSISDGLVSGSRATTTTDKTFYTFFGIPFATPPINDLRFKPPIPPKPWAGVWNASQRNDVICHQVSSNSELESEDCLYLNVYTPRVPSIDDSGEALPVMFYIYGGGFQAGDCPFDGCGPEFLVDRDVILVTINYRLGPFGFLSTGDQVLPGNMGLKDQSLALKWTFDNIAEFGGDPQKITIFGQSAGSASVTYQLLNPQSRGLFRGAICESGAFLTPFSFVRDPRRWTISTAIHIDKNFNPDSSSEELLNFLSSVNATTLDHAASLVRDETDLQHRELVQGHYYGPVIEPENTQGAVFTEKQYGLLKNGNFTKVPVLIGINSEEAVAEAGNLEWLKEQMTLYDENMDWMVPNSMRITNETLHSQIAQKIHDLYAGEGKKLQDDLANGIRFWSDAEFARGIIKFAKMLSAHTDVYFYQFSYDGVLGNQNTRIDGAGSVAHSEELPYVFRMTNPNYDNSDLSKFPEEDVLTQNRIQQIWTDFAKFLNPTPEPTDLLQNLIWPKVSPNNYQYVDINENLEIKIQPKVETFPQWEAMFDSLGYDDFDNY